jgi:hypothetical protein
MAISDADVRRLISAATDTSLGQRLANAVNMVAQSGFYIPAVIVASSTSTTTNFGALAIGDRVVIVPATAGNAQFVTVAAAGTLPQPAVVGSLYIVLRAKEAGSTVTY